MITAQELRQKYFEFFESKGHTRIPSASLVPENDPTVLFTAAGMHPLVPYLLGEKHPGGKRVVSVQKCVRTDDIEEVGDATHHTFFEMLGNWSFGDYFKKEAIEWSWEFLTSKKWLGIDKNRLAISIFAGDKDAPLDEESKKIWLSLGVPEERLAALPKKNNWWGPAGQTGPCGPDTEMFYWSPGADAPERFDPDDPAWVEIWNDVFMQYYKKSDGSFVALDQKNVDTGMGMERTLAVLNGYDDNYRTELFWPVIESLEKLSNKKYIESTRPFRIIADHLRAATFLLAEGVRPANVEKGYILRRLIRRSIRYGKELGITETFTSKIAGVVMREMSEVFPELKREQKSILQELAVEEEKFKKAIIEGLKAASQVFASKKPIVREKFIKLMQAEDKTQLIHEAFESRRQNKPHGLEQFGISQKEFYEATVSGEESFYLYQSFGLPIEMILELARDKDLFVSITDFRNEVKRHQELSRTASIGRFKGGLADNSEMTTKYHTATHLLQAALRQVLGEHVQQKGSNITAERLRFDFSHQQKMTPEEIKKVEDWVNEVIKKDYSVSWQEMTVEEAKRAGAIGLFGDKYSERVKVYTIGNPVETRRGASHGDAHVSPPAKGGIEGGLVSREICGGPHVESTGVLGKFKIQKEEASSAGVRRIKAVLF